MCRQMMKSKIHRAIVTEASLSYVGSIAIDSHLVETAYILPIDRISQLFVELLSKVIQL